MTVALSAGALGLAWGAVRTLRLTSPYYGDRPSSTWYAALTCALVVASLLTLIVAAWMGVYAS